jgi:hypothetical protein
MGPAPLLTLGCPGSVVSETATFQRLVRRRGTTLADTLCISYPPIGGCFALDVRRKKRRFLGIVGTHRQLSGLARLAEWNTALLEDTDLPFTFTQVESQVNSGWAAERAARADAFVTENQAQVAKRAPRSPNNAIRAE